MYGVHSSIPIKSYQCKLCEQKFDPKRVCAGHDGKLHSRYQHSAASAGLVRHVVGYTNERNIAQTILCKQKIERQVYLL